MAVRNRVAAANERLVFDSSPRGGTQSNGIQRNGKNGKQRGRNETKGKTP